MLQVICGFVVGLLLAGLGFGLVGGGVPGLIVAVVLAALGYIAASTLTEPERRIGKMLVSALPNGQKTADNDRRGERSTQLDRHAHQAST